MFAQMWLCMHEWCQSWVMTICFQPQSRLCKHLSFFTNIYIFKIIIYSHFKFHNNWFRTRCHQSWLTSFMHTQSRLCKHLSLFTYIYIYIYIYIFPQSLYTHIPNFITICWKHIINSHDWHNSCMHICACMNDVNHDWWQYVFNELL